MSNLAIGCTDPQAIASESGELQAAQVQALASHREPMRLTRQMRTVIALVVALSGPAVLVWGAKRLFGDAPTFGISIALQLLYFGIAGFVLWIVLRKERLPLASIGLRRPRWSTLLIAGLLWLISLQLLPLLTGPLLDAGGTATPEGLSRLASFPIWFRVVQALTGGAIEEILYRGYAIERLTTITGRPWLAAVIAAIGFGIAHVPSWGIRYAVIADLPFGIVATLCYLWRRDLLANILAHDVGLLVALLSISSGAGPG